MFKKRTYVGWFLTAAGALLVGVFAFPAPALAQESSGLGIGLIIPKLGEFVPMLIAFLVIWAVLAKFAWPQLTGMLDKRAMTIKESLESAEAAKIEAQQLLEEYKQQISSARRESAEILDEARKAGEKVKAQITAAAKSEADEIVAKASVAIENEKKAALRELQESVATLSVDVASKLIGEKLSEDEHRALIEKYVMEAGHFDAK